MWKHVLTSSIQSAFVGSLLLIIVCMPIYGGAATIFGFVAFPIAFAISILLQYLLIHLWQYYAWSSRLGLVVYICTGFVFGFLLQ